MAEEVRGLWSPKVKHLDLFSGIGGFALAASWVWGDEHEIVSFVEIDPFCQKVLKKHWPDVPIISDIMEYKHNGTAIDLLTGGFPCQPFSQAGKQRGSKDDRYLWPEMLRVIREIRPTWIIGENVAGIINMELDKVLSDLEDSDYETQCFVISACGVDAPHRRDRVWIVGHSIQQGLQGYGNTQDSDSEGWEMPSVSTRQTGWKCDVADTTSTGHDRTQGYEAKQGSNQQKNRISQRVSFWLPEPNVGRVANGVPNRVDRLKSLGNAIVPQVVVPIMEAIRDTVE